MKKTIFLLSLVLVFALVIGCASKKEEPKSVIAPPAKAPYTVIDTKTMAIGGQTPRWVLAAMEGKTKVRELYPNNAVFIQERSGTNKDALEFWLNTFAVNTELSQALSTYVKNVAGATTATDMAKMNQAAEAFTAVASKAQFSGLQKEADFWTLKQFSEDGRKEYTYYVLYLMPKAIYDRQIDDLLNKLPDTEKAVIQPIVDKAKAEIGNAY